MVLKRLALAGAMAIVTTGFAFAADLLPPPPMPPAEPIAMEFSGWYLRGDVGVSALRSSTWSHPDVDNLPTTAWNDHSIGDSAFVGAGIGYQFNSWLRFDVTGEYRTSAAINATASYTAFCPALTGTCYDLYQGGQVTSGVFLANGYVDLGTWRGLTPYVGAGVGTAYVKTSKISDFGPQTGGSGWIAGATKWNLAWALMAGVAYDVTPNLKLELGYRYINLGDAPLGIMTCPGGGGCGNGTGKIKQVDAQEFKLGMRWMLGGPVTYAEPPRPLVRKF